MKYWVANTDLDWFSYLASRAPLDEVNFWQPSVSRPITLPEGGLWLFKLHVRNGGWVVGGGYFATFTTAPPRFAWEAFGELNGAGSFDEFLRKLSGYSQRTLDPDRTTIGSNVLVEPFFLPRELWIPSPTDWASNLTRGRSYDSGSGEGAVLWQRLQVAREAMRRFDGVGVADAKGVAYGEPMLVRPRLGQGAFRIMVTDAYERRCVVTNERTLPVLEAAHIKPFSLVGTHEVANGLLLRSDLHTLFDRGYVTVTPDLRFRVSRRIRDEFDNGRDYYALDNREIRSPRAAHLAPSAELLEWHADSVFRS